MSSVSILMNNHHHSLSSPNLMSSSYGGGVGGVSSSSSSTTTASSVSGSDLLAIIVPEELKRLIRLIMRVFYQFELFLCVEMLLIYPCLKEEDLAELLRLDLKLVHQYLINLKKEKFLNEKCIMETSADDKQSKHSYFYINYKMVVNVIKYKLDRIRIQIELDENQFTTRAQFKCTDCGKTYSDLDTKDIFLTMRCNLCGADVDEDTSALPKQSARNLMSKFNTQMAPIFELLSRVEHIRLADCVLRPEPVDMTYVLERMKNNPVGGAASTGGAIGPNGKAATTGKSAMIKYDRWSGDKTRYSDLLSKTQIQVNLDSGGTNNQAKRSIKELPSVIALNRTGNEDYIDEANNRDSILLNSVRQAADETLNNSAPSSSTATNEKTSTFSSTFIKTTTSSGTGAESLSSQLGAASSQNLELIIMQKLLKHEKKATNGTTVADSPVALTAPESTSSSSNSPKMMSNQNVPMQTSLTTAAAATLGGQSVPISSITITKKRPIGDNSAVVDISSSSSRDLGAFKHSNGSFVSTSDIKNEFYSQQSQNNFDETDIFLMSKKRKLNNGEVNYLKRNHSDGSASENSSEASYGFNKDSEFFDADYTPMNGDIDMVDDTNTMMIDDEDEELDQFIPRVSVQNRPIRFDRVTPKLISMMSQSEKDDYIDICKQLYTEIYEI